MQRIVLFIAVFISITTTAQENISVKSFRSLPQDLDARVNYPVVDQNGDKAALIKIETTETGFKFEGGMLGVVKVEKKTGEYWVYVPYGARKITIKHDNLGVLRDYVYPEAIKEATVYEMVLTTGKVVTTVEDAVIESQWLIIKTTPDGANVFIDEQLVGITPFQGQFKEGEHTYRIEKSKYHNNAGRINLVGEKKTLDIALKPKFGNISITSSPENGMQIYLDDENTGKTTPASLEEVSSGEHRVKLQSQWYKPQIKTISVQDEQTANADFTMQPAFADVSISAKPNADILINGERKGSGNWNGRLLSGIYTVKAEKDKHYSEEKQLEITAGQDETLSFDLKGKTGSVDVVTTPMEAKVYLNGEYKGTSPMTLKDLLIGEYEIGLEKSGYAKKHISIIVSENTTKTLNEELVNGKNVLIQSVPSKAKVYVDKEELGITPYLHSFKYGNYKVEIIKGDKISKKNINVEPEGDDVFQFELKPKQKLFLQYSASFHAPIGIMIGELGGTAWYFSIKSDADIKNTFKPRYTYEGGNWRPDLGGAYYYIINDEQKKNRYSITAGATAELNSSFFLYLGAGFGVKELWWQMDIYDYADGEKQNSEFIKAPTPDCIGFEQEIGLIYKKNRLTFNLGMTTVNYQYVDFVLGFGYLLEK